MTDYTCTDAVCGADTDAANGIGPCIDSERIHTRIGQ